MILLFSLLLVLFVFLGIRTQKREKIKAVENMLQRRRKKRQSRLQSLTDWQIPTLARTKNMVLLATLPSMIGGAIGLSSINISPVLGAILGAGIPYLAVTQWRRFYEVRYREDAKRAIQFAGAIFAAGGSVEEWIVEVVPRLEGPLRADFEQGVRNYRQNIPVTKFLESLIQRSPDAYFQYVLAGLLANYRSAGDLKQFVSEVMDDIVNQERFTRVMSEQRKSGQQMLLFVMGFPAFMYLMFKDTVHLTLKQHPGSIFVFIIGIAGLFGFWFWGNRMTRSNLFNG